MTFSSFSQYHYYQSFTLSTSFVSSHIMYFVTLLAIAAAAVSASPVERRASTVVLPLQHHSNFTSIKNIVSKGQARINKINGVKAVGASPDVSSGSVTNDDVSYVAPVVIGGSTWQLIVDTGCTSLLQDAQEALETLY
jgi:hypothetical protein